MKKSIIQIVIAVIIATGIVTLQYRFIDKPPAEELNTKKDAQGNAYLVVYDKEHNECVAVQGDDGRIYAAHLDDNGNMGEPVTNPDGSIYYLEDIKSEELPTNEGQKTFDPFKQETTTTADTSGSSSEKETTTFPSEQTTAVGTEPEDTTSASNDERTTEGKTLPQQTTTDASTSTTQPPPTQDKYLADKYKRIFESGTYMIKFNIDDEELGSTPVTAAFKGGNVLMGTTMMNIELTMIYNTTRNTGYVVLHGYKKYSKLPEDLLADMQDTADGKITDGEYNEVIVNDHATLNNETVTCEEYHNKDGSLTRYYFKNGDLICRDFTDIDGSQTVMNIELITSDVPDSTFEIPSNYGYINLSWLGFLTGDTSSAS